MGHGEKEMQKPVSEMAKYIKNLVPANIAEDYNIKPMFNVVASDENIRKGVIAFRDFLYIFCDCLISDGHLYVKLKKTYSPTDYPFLHNISNLLVDIGYHGKFSENNDSLLLTGVPLCTGPKAKMSGNVFMECLRFLTLCGLEFTGVDLNAKMPDFSENPLVVTYPHDPLLLTGLIALSIADMELRESRRYWNDLFLLGCHYWLLQVEPPDMLGILKNLIHPLSDDVKQFILELHKRYIDMGLTCVTFTRADTLFAYSLTKNSKSSLSTQDIYQKRVWEFAVSMKDGYCMRVRSKKTDKYPDIIAGFHPFLQNKIAQGYGCDRKLRGERCQGGCQGIRLPLNETIVEMKQDIITWLDQEI